MVDFKAMLEKRQAEQGYCRIPDNKYATIQGWRTHNATNVVTPVDIHWICEWKSDRKVLTLLNGVTGYENWNISDLVEFGLFTDSNEFFCACAGTPNRWDTLMLDCKQVQEVVKALLELKP